MFKGDKPIDNDAHLQDGPAVHMVRKIIATTACFSILAAVLHSFGWDMTYPLERYFGLSTAAVQNLWLWQPLTYVFLNYTEYGLSLPFCLYLFFNLYVVSLVGIQVANEIGPRSFLRLFFMSGATAAAVIFSTSWLLNEGLFFTGNTAPLNTLLTVWCLLIPEVELLLFFVFPVKMKWLWLSLMTLQMLMALPVASSAGIQAIAAGTLIGYVYAIGFMRLPSCFAPMQMIDRTIVHLVQYFSYLQKHNKSETYDSKIYDFKTGKAILGDEEFVDVILEKISKQGEKSLTRNERRRMNQIAESKRRS